MNKEERREAERAEIAEIRSAAAECNQALIEDIEGLARDLKAERARSAKLIEALRKIRNADSTCWCGRDAHNALAEYEVSE